MRWGLRRKRKILRTNCWICKSNLQWLREIGFVDVDCLWKWRELALLVGRKR